MTMAELEQLRERLRRPPCWGPNEQGDYMVDMTVEAYERDLDVLMKAARIDGVRTAQRVLAGEDTVEWARTATGSSLALSYAMEVLDSLADDCSEEGS